MGIFDFLKRKKTSGDSNREESKNIIINTVETNNGNKDENLDIKALAYVYNMIYVAFSNNGKIDMDAMHVIFECSTEVFNLKDPNKYFNICNEQFKDEYIHKKHFVHKKYLNSLSTDEIEELFYQLLRLILSDRKLMNVELNALGNIASLCNYPSEDFNNMIEKTLNNLYLIETTENHYQFLSYFELFNSALDKFDSHEYEDSLKCYDLFLSMISQDKLLFGQLIDGKIYIERYGDDTEVLPLENVFFNRGQCYSNLGEHTKALSDLTKALEINPNVSDPRFFHNIGTTLFKLGHHTSCINFFDEAIKLDDNSSSDSYFNRACAYLSDKCEIQNINNFFDDMKKYLEFNPEDDAAKNLLKEVEKSNEGGKKNWKTF